MTSPFMYHPYHSLVFSTLVGYASREFHRRIYIWERGRGVYVRKMNSNPDYAYGCISSALVGQTAVHIVMF